MKQTHILLLAVSLLISTSCEKPNTVPAKFEMRPVLGNSIENDPTLGEIIVDNLDIADARVSLHEKRPCVKIRMTSGGSDKFAKFTELNVGTKIALLLNGEIMSSPLVQEPIYGGRALLTFPEGTTKEQAKKIAKGILLFKKSASKK